MDELAGGGCRLGAVVVTAECCLLTTYLPCSCSSKSPLKGSFL